MRKSQWTDEKLTRLYGYYNRKYWSGRLPAYRVEIADLTKEGAVGLCNYRHRIVQIDTAKHRSDRVIRSTLLHEMAHVATSRNRGHGEKFWEQLERLLRKGALVEVGFSEAPDLHVLEGAIPRRFRLCRAAAGKAEKPEQLEIERLLRERPDDEIITISDEMIADSFGEAASQGLTWQQALYAIGQEHGLLDIDGRPKNKWATLIVEKGRRAFRKGRRFYLDDERQRAAET